MENTRNNNNFNNIPEQQNNTNVNAPIRPPALNIARRRGNLNANVNLKAGTPSNDNYKPQK